VQFAYELTVKDTKNKHSDPIKVQFRGIRLPEDPAILSYYIRCAFNMELNEFGEVICCELLRMKVYLEKLLVLPVIKFNPAPIVGSQTGCIVLK
jgi:hypothetical protein